MRTQKGSRLLRFQSITDHIEFTGGATMQELDLPDMFLCVYVWEHECFKNCTMQLVLSLFVYIPVIETVAFIISVSCSPMRKSKSESDCNFLNRTLFVSFLYCVHIVNRKCIIHISRTNNNCMAT